MLTHDAVLWQYVAAASSTPRWPQHDVACTRCRCTTAPSWTCSSARRLHRLDQRHHRQAPPGQPAPMMAARDHQLLPRPRCGSSLLRSPLFDQTDLSQLAKGYYGASIMPVEVLKESPAACRRCGCGTCTARPRSRRWRPCSGRRPAAKARLPAAQVLNVETRVVDDDMRDVGVGEVGEIVHRSPHLMLGYFNDERNRRGLHGRLVSLAAIWGHRRRRLHQRGRPQEGHDQDRRRKSPAARSRR